MSAALLSRLDFSIANAARARRLAAPTIALDEKLVLLRRLVRRDIDGTLLGMTETSVEQSWNEQLFACIFDYQTLFSHDHVPFNLRPKGHAKRSYNDFSLGFFGPEHDLVLASAELKPRRTDLDAAQSGTYRGCTPVQQARDTARNTATCRWVLVSNFVELRLYETAEANPLAIAVLTDVRSRHDLAALLAHFDRRALLGSLDPRDNGGEMANALTTDNDHPSAVVPRAAGCYRIVARFTPTPKHEFALFEAEGRLRTAMNSGQWSTFIDHPDPELGRCPVRRKDGWVAVDGRSRTNNISMRVAASLAGEIQVSAAIRGSGDRLQVDVDWVFAVVAQLMWVVGVFAPRMGIAQLSDAPDAGMPLEEGLVSAELRDVKNAYMIVTSPLHDPTTNNEGVCSENDVQTGDFVLGDGDGTGLVVKCAAELAAHFRDTYGGVGLDATTARKRADDLMTRHRP